MEDQHPAAAAPWGGPRCHFPLGPSGGRHHVYRSPSLRVSPPGVAQGSVIPAVLRWPCQACGSGLCSGYSNKSTTHWVAYKHRHLFSQFWRLEAHSQGAGGLHVQEGGPASWLGDGLSSLCSLAGGQGPPGPSFVGHQSHSWGLSPRTSPPLPPPHTILFWIRAQCEF